MNITRNDIIVIAKKPYNLVGYNATDEIDYLSWVNFIECNKDFFVWYEETSEGKEALQNIDKVPVWAKERVLYVLDKKRVLVTSKLMENPTDLVITYSESDKRVSISLEKKANEKSAELIFAMAKYLNALVLKNGSEIISEDVLNDLS